MDTGETESNPGSSDQMHTIGSQDWVQSDSGVTLSAQELLALVERTISAKMSKEEPKSKKLKTENLRYKGNQKQVEFNLQIRDSVANAINSIQAKQYQKASDILEELTESLDGRNKMVRLADRSGWDTVEEYLGDAIASDSDDERRIRSAEQRAMRKRKNSQPYKPFRGGARGRWPRAGSSFRSGFDQGFREYQPKQGYGFQFAASESSSAGTSKVNHYGKGGRVSGACYYCGKQGHWAIDCSERKK